MSEEITLKFYHKVKKNKTGDVYSLFVCYIYEEGSLCSHVCVCLMMLIINYYMNFTCR